MCIVFQVFYTDSFGYCFFMMGAFSSRYTGYFSYYSPSSILEYHFDEITRKSRGIYV